MTTCRQRLHFDLLEHGADTAYTLTVALKDYPLRRHTPDSIAEARANSQFYPLVPDDHLTHYVEVDLPFDLVGLMEVTRKVELDGQPIDWPVAMAIHIPPVSFQLALASGWSQPPYAALEAFPLKLERFGVTPASVLSAASVLNDPQVVAIDAANYVDARETAIALLYQHPSILHLDGTTQHPAWIRHHLLDRNPYLNDLVLTIHRLKDRWSEVVKAIGPMGEPLRDPDDESKFLYTRKLHPDVVSAMAGPLSWAIKRAQDAPELEGQTWVAMYGRASDEYEAQVRLPDEPEPAPRTAGGVRWSLKNHTPSWGLALDQPQVCGDTITVTGYNRFARHLSTYVEFLDANGKRVNLSEEQWSQIVDGTLRKLLPRGLYAEFEPRKETRFLDYILPITTVCGVPVGKLLPDASRFDIPVLDGRIHTVRMLWGGVGLITVDSDDANGVCAAIGTILTVVLDIVVPVSLLIVGATGVTNMVLKEIMKDKETFKDVLILGSMVITLDVLKKLNDGRTVMTAVGPWVSRLLPGLIITKLGPYLLKKLGEGSLGKLLGRILPGADTVMLVFSTLTTGTQLLATTIAVLESPSIHKTDFTRSLDLTVTLLPDKLSSKFPDLATHYRVAVVYNNETTIPVLDRNYDLKGPTRSKPFSVTFKDVPAGGTLKVLVFFYAQNGWQAGQGESPTVPAVGNDNAELKLDVQITTNEVPLTRDSVYIHRQKLTIRDGKHRWIAAPAPTATHRTVSTDPERSINVLKGGITVAQRPAAVGYNWQARGLESTEVYTVQNLSILEDPELGHWHPEVNYRLPTSISYDVDSDGESHFNCFVDPGAGTWSPDNPAGGYHLRKMALKKDAPPVVDRSRSWGRFNAPPDRIAVHPQGYVFGINYAASKLEILKLFGHAFSDAAAPFAVLASGQGFRDGLINGPSGLAVTLDGRVLILESINNRVQAFDVFGNPVRCFKPGSWERSWFSLIDPPRGAQYLDLAAEAKGHIYVLSYTGDGSSPEHYHMDIYSPNGRFLVRTGGVAAARLAVDLMRSVYTLNFETLLTQDRRPEPSLSVWIPPAPNV